MKDEYALRHPSGAEAKRNRCLLLDRNPKANCPTYQTETVKVPPPLFLKTHNSTISLIIHDPMDLTTCQSLVVAYFDWLNNSKGGPKHITNSYWSNFPYSNLYHTPPTSCLIATIIL